MLLDCHELNGVVSQAGDARKDVFTKLCECSDFAFLLRHANVGFVDAWARLALRIRVLKLEAFFGLPELADKVFGSGVLDDAANVRGNAILKNAPGKHVGFQGLTVLKRSLGQKDRPDPILVTTQRIGRPIPTFKFAGETELLRAGSPLAGPDSTLARIEPEVVMPGTDEAE